MTAVCSSTSLLSFVTANKLKVNRKKTPNMINVSTKLLQFSMKYLNKRGPLRPKILESDSCMKKLSGCGSAYNVQLQIVSEPVGALHSHQNGVFLLSAEAHG